MKQTTTRLAPQRRPGLQTLKSALQRLTMTLMLVMLTAMTAWATTENVNYIDENGQTQTVTATLLTDDLLNSDLGIDGATTWYVVNDNITHSGQVTCRGNVNLILADGKTMTTSNTGTYAIYGDNGTLTIYGQTLGTGTLEASGYGASGIYHLDNVTICGGTVNATSSHDAINVRGSVTISGGTVNTNGNTGIIGTSGVTINGGTITTSSNCMIGIASNGTVTINGGTVNANSQTGIRGNGGVTINGGQVTATATNGDQGIISYGDIILGWTNATDFIKASSYQVNGSGTVNIADGQAFLTDDATPVQIKGTVSELSLIAGKTLTPDLSYAPEITVSYVKADGTTDTHQAKVLTGNETTLDAGWYVVISNITYTGTVSLGDGEVTIILANGKTMNIGTEQQPISNGEGIKYGNYSYDSSLTIYGQTAQGGTLRITAFDVGIYCETLTINSGTVNVSSSTSSIYATWVIINGGTVNVSSSTSSSIYATWVIINGGVVTATANGQDVNNQIVSNLLSYSIFSSEGVSINGGQVTATGNSGRIASGNSSDITLGYTKATDFISFKIINAAGEVKIANDKSMTDGTNTYNSSTSSEMLEALTDVTLRPFKAITLADNADNTSAISGWNGGVANVTLSGRTLWKDGAWNTLCLPFAVSTTSGPLSGDNVEAMVLNGGNSGLSGTTLTLNFDAAPATIPAGTPFIVKWDNTGENITNPVFNGVTIDKTNRDVAFTGGWFKGTYEKMAFAEENKSILFVGDDNNLHWPKEGASLGACRAYFELSDVEPGGGGGNAPELRIVLNFGEEEKTGISSLTPDPSPKGKGSDYYTLDGRKLNAKPMKKGLYIHNGRKVVIK